MPTDEDMATAISRDLFPETSGLADANTPAGVPENQKATATPVKPVNQAVENAQNAPEAGDFNEAPYFSWRAAPRKENQSADQLLQIGIKYSGDPASFYAITQKLKNERGWNDKQVDEFSSDVSTNISNKNSEYYLGMEPGSPWYNKYETLRNAQQQIDRDYSMAIQRDELAADRPHNIVYSEVADKFPETSTQHGVNPSLTSQRNAINTLIGDHVRDKLSELGGIVGEVDNFNSLFNFEGGRQRAKAVRGGVEQMLKLVNPGSSIQYNDKGLFVNGEKVNESVRQQMMASLGEVIGLGVGTLAGVGMGYIIGRGTPLGRATLGLTALGTASGGGGAYIDKQMTINKLDEFIQADFDRFQVVDDVLEYAAIDTLFYAGGKVVGGAINAFSRLGKVNRTNEEVIDTLVEETGISQETLLKRANQFIDSRIVGGQEGTTKIMNRKLLRKEKSQTYNLKKYKDLSDADKIFLYLIHTDPLGTGVLSNVFEKHNTIKKNMILNSAAFRGKQIREELDKSKITKEDYIRIRDNLSAHQTNLHDDLNTFYRGDVFVDAGSESVKFMLDTATKSGVIKNKLYGDIMSGVAARAKNGKISTYNLVDVYRANYSQAANSTTNKQTMEKFKEYIRERITADNAGTENAGEEFLGSLDRLIEFDELVESSILKAFKDPTIKADELLGLLQDYNSSVYGGINYNALTKAIGEQDLIKVENAVIDFQVLNNSVNLERESSDTVIDFVKLSRDLTNFTPTTRQAADLKVFIDEQAKVFKNDINIVGMFSPNLNLNPSSGASIAETVLGKIQVEIASRSLEFIKANAPFVQNKFKTAKFFKEAVLTHFTNDPLDQKKYMELLEYLRTNPGASN